MALTPFWAPTVGHKIVLLGKDGTPIRYDVVASVGRAWLMMLYDVQTDMIFLAAFRASGEWQILGDGIPLSLVMNADGTPTGITWQQMTSRWEDV